MVKLEITNDSGNTLHLYNTPEDKDSLLFNEDYGFTWYLESMYIDGSYTAMSPNAEFGEITATFNYDGSFETEVCGTLTGNFTLGGGDSLQDFYMNCGQVNIGNSTCVDPQNTSIQEQYFNFFSENSQEKLVLYFEIIDGQTGPCTAEVFHLESPSGDYIEFTSCSLLNVPKENQIPISVYPNPTTDYLYFDTPNQNRINQIFVTDITGKTVKQFHQVENKIDISSFANGIYFLKIKIGSQTLTQKIIKK